MQVATAPAIAAPSSFTICFNCAYQSSGPGSVCSRCGFPFITRSEMSPAAGIRLSDVLHRESIRIGAPPLPGVHTEIREAQALAQARRSSQSQPAPLAEANTAGLARDAAGSALWNVVCVCLLAVGIGVAAAVMQSAL